MIKYKIKALRIGKGFKAGEFAEKVGISREYLRQIENGTAKNPSCKIMKKISEILEMSIDELFFI